MAEIHISNDHNNLLKMSGQYRSIPYKSVLLISWQILFTSLSLMLSFSDNWFLWILGQFLLGINMLQWFFVLHDLAHHSLFKNKLVNSFFGHIASVFCLLPYNPWLYIHNSHHKWTGWREFDPTIPPYNVEDLSDRQIKLIDFCWKYHVPIFAVNYSLQTFFNLKKLFVLYPKTKAKFRNVFSVSFIILTFTFVIFFLGIALFLKIWLLAFLIFLSISDPVLLSQHTHLDYHDIETKEVKPIRYIEHPLFTRSVEYPKFIERFIFYSSSKHGLHHQVPWVPVYHLHHLPEPEENKIHWLEWLKTAKSMPGHLLIFKSYKHTGIRL